MPPGDVVGGFGAGGMPSFAVPGVGDPERVNTGHGVGAALLLERGFTTDYAVIAKPGWHVLHEEVGLVWLDVVVPGQHTYAGSRHRLPYSNAVATAGRVAIALEEWLDGYAVRHEHGTMLPQGIVSSVHGGFDRLAASTPAQVRLRLDLRLTTQQTPPAVVREVRDELRRLSEQLGVELQVRQVAAIPATHTPPDSPVVRAAVEAFEAVDGHPHQRHDGQQRRDRRQHPAHARRAHRPGRDAQGRRHPGRRRDRLHARHEPRRPVGDAAARRGAGAHRAAAAQCPRSTRDRRWLTTTPEAAVPTASSARPG